jgi:hypothetical protein
VVVVWATDTAILAVILVRVLLVVVPVVQDCSAVAHVAQFAILATPVILVALMFLADMYVPVAGLYMFQDITYTTVSSI